MSDTASTLKNSSGSNYLVVVGDETTGFDLDIVANQLREEISRHGLALAKRELATQAGVKEVLLVVRDHEDPHTHPNADLLFTVLEGGGWLQRTPDPNPETKFEVIAGTTVVVPKGVCHAFHNTSDTDSVLLATFSPADSSHKDGCPQNPLMRSPSQHTRPRRHR